MSHTHDYWVGPVLGQGSFARVVYGKHKSTDHPVAIKVLERVMFQRHPQLLPGILLERQLLERFAQQPSPFVVRLLASFVDTQCVYLVMELATGGDLASLMMMAKEQQTQQTQQPSQKNENKHEDENENSTPKALWLSSSWQRSIPYYAWQLVQGIQYIHSQKIVHCDIKPQNILCHTDGRLMLTDFGSAIALVDTFQPNYNNNNNNNNVPRGTMEYSCPELIQGMLPQFLTEAVDLWSLGCLLYAMLGNGSSPFHTDSEALTVQTIMDYKKQQQQQQNKTETNEQQSSTTTNSNTPLIQRLPMNGSGNAIATTATTTTIPNEWESTVQGLLLIDPIERTKAWTALVASSSSSSSLLASERPSDLLLPKAPWNDEEGEEVVDPAELKDGALGWPVFVL